MKFKKVMLGIGVGILAALFITFFIDAIYSVPRYEDFCSSQPIFFETKAENQSICNYTYNASFRNQCLKEGGMIIEEYGSNGCVVKEKCDFCNKNFNDANERYSLNLFYITAPIGLLMIILGLYLPASIDAIAGGILFGGILTMIQITARIFGNLGKWPRVILLGVELIIIIWIGLKKVRDNPPKKKRE